MPCRPHVPHELRQSRRTIDCDPLIKSRLVFERYEVEPSAWAVVRWARETGLMFPTRHWHEGGTTDVTWKPLGASRLHEMLRNPLYAGAYVYGRRPEKTVLVDGQVRRVRSAGRDPDQWAVRIEGHTRVTSPGRRT
jgi:hypothetical protein